MIPFPRGAVPNKNVKDIDVANSGVGGYGVGGGGGGAINTQHTREPSHHTILFTPIYTTCSIYFGKVK